MEIIKFQGSYVPSSYLGDGVYAIFDGHGIWLHANDHEHPTDKIYLEPEILKRLGSFALDSRKEGVIKQCQERNQKEKE